MKFDSINIKRFFGGKYSRADYMVTRSLFTDIARREELLKYMENQWLDLDKEPLPEGNIDHLLDKIHHRIRLEAGPTRRHSFTRVFQRVAAILIIPLLLGSLALYYSQSNNNQAGEAMAEIQCPLGVRTKFLLPDGTTGFLNSGSTLEYQVNFSSERDVTLQGEAYFDVAPDKERPFTVHTPHLVTRVLGTRFIVIAYGDESCEEIILREGKVEISSSHGKKLATLGPDQKLGYNTINGIFKSSQVEASQFISWTEGKLVFRNESMQEVARRLGRWYNADIEIQDKELLDYAMWATFIDEPLEEVLKLMTYTAPMSYEELIRETTHDTVYKKRKVILRFDKERQAAF
jgi:transmembrane sensor